MSVGGDRNRPELLLADPVRDLDVSAHPDPEQPASVAVLPTRRLLRAELLVAGRLQHPVERAAVVADVVVGSGCRLVREGVGRDEVPPAHLGGVELELGRERVDRSLHPLRRLGTAGATDGGGARRVRHDRPEVDVDLRDAVRPARHQAGEIGQERTDARVCARVLGQAEPQRLDRPVPAAADLEIDPLGASVGERNQVLGPRLGPADGLAGRAGEVGDQGVLAVQALAAEAAAHVGSDDAHLI